MNKERNVWHWCSDCCNNINGICKMNNETVINTVCIGGCTFYKRKEDDKCQKNG